MLTGPFRGDDALAGGLLTRNELYGPRFQRVFPGVFVPKGLSVDLQVRSLAAYLLVRDRGGVLAGYSAALLLGADCAPRNAPAEVRVPADARAHPGLLVRRGPTPAADVVPAAGCRVTSPMRTAWDLTRRLPLVEAVVALDALARCGGFPPASLLGREPGARGVRRLPSVVDLADPRAESPMETRLRVGLVRGGAPRPEVQYAVRDEYDFVLARVDLAYPSARLAIEYDGAGHNVARRRLLDNQRDAVLAEEGWETMRLSRDDVLDLMSQTVSRVNRALHRRAPTAYGRVEIDTSRLDSPW